MAEQVTVLLVEDEQSFVEALVVGLKREGFHVDVAYDGAEALDKFNAVQPDLVLLDVMLPKVSGIDVCRTIRAAGPSMRNSLGIRWSFRWLAEGRQPLIGTPHCRQAPPAVDMPQYLLGPKLVLGCECEVFVGILPQRFGVRAYEPARHAAMRHRHSYGIGTGKLPRLLQRPMTPGQCLIELSRADQ